MMGYYGNYGERQSKIPYDEVPITRNERAQRGFSSHREGMRLGRFASIAVSFTIIANVILSVVCLFLIKNIRPRIINHYNIEVGSTGEVSAVVKNSALSTSVSVSVGASSGSGVIYKVVPSANNDNQGTIYFVTCYHVVSDNTKNVKVQMSLNSTKLPVTVVGYSKTRDVAVLSYYSNNLEWDLNGCTEASIFNSAYAAFGEKVFAIGNSLSYGLSITEGLISQVNVLINLKNISDPMRCLQTSAEINPGNSGGGLFNAKGQLVGLVNAKMHSASSDGEVFTVVGTSYAIPSSIVVGVAEQIIAGATEVSKVALGAEFINSNDKRLELVEYNGELRQIEVYTVSISAVGTGGPYGALMPKDVIEAFQFISRGETEYGEKIPMYNKYSFDDYSLQIKAGTYVKFYIAGREQPVEVKVKESDFVK